MDRKRLSRSLAMVVFLLVVMACTCSLPTQLAQNPTAVVQEKATITLVPSVTPAPTEAAVTPSATPLSPPVFNDNGVRTCDYVPGVSQVAQMPPEVTHAPLPTPFPLPTPPAPTTVDAAITERQLGLYREIWNHVREEYYDPTFQGLDWAVVGAKYEAMIQQGLSDDDFYLAMQLMIGELNDEHSYYLSPEEVAEQEEFMRGNHDFVGIGAISQTIEEEGRAIIISVFPGSPAEEAGIRPHDAMLAVDGGPVLDANGSPNTLGDEGTTFVLTIQRPGEEPHDLTITRRRVTGAWPIESCIIEEQRIGYIFLPTFLDETIDDQVRDVLERMTADGPLNGLILDNRLNGGGASNVVHPILGFFTSGVMGHFVSRDSEQAINIDAEDIGGSQAVPLVVLIGRDSASYGEISSGVLGASGRAILIGETTLGNVEVLRLFSPSDASELWLATDTFQPVGLESGIWEETGIVPDFTVPTRWDLFVEGNDPALAKAVEVLMEQVPVP